MFKEQWHGPGEYLSPAALGFYLLEHERTGSGRRAQRGYARIAPGPGKVRITFYGRAVSLCPDAFDQVKQGIEFETWNNPSDPEDPYAELIFPLDSTEWETHKETLTALTKAVYAAWESSGQDDGVDSAQPVEAGA